MDFSEREAPRGRPRARRAARPPSPPETRRIAYAGETIDYTLVRSDRRSTEFAVRTDGTVRVRGPFFLSPEAFDRKVAAKGRWILEQLAYFRHYAPQRTVLRYLPGEEHLFLGTRYRLLVRKAPRPSVRLVDDRIEVSLRGEAEAEGIRRSLERWYREEARRAFQASLERCWPAFADDGRPKPFLTLRKMRRCWGTMSSKGKMTLNLDLVRASPACIDYVVTHELCHLSHPNHGKGFYRLLGERMADWRERKRDLEATLA